MRHAEGQGEEERARAARLRNQPGCLPRAVGAGGRGVCRAHRKHEISTSPGSTRGTRGAPGARQSPAARRACIQKQRAAQIRHLKQQLNEYMQVHLFALLLICSCSRSLSVCIYVYARSCFGVRVSANQAEAAARDGGSSAASPARSKGNKNKKGSRSNSSSKGSSSKGSSSRT